MLPMLAQFSTNSDGKLGLTVQTQRWEKAVFAAVLALPSEAVAGRLVLTSSAGGHAVWAVVAPAAG